jgi:nitrite reductase/ring-hydroxylating ferredoxin subunit
MAQVSVLQPGTGLVDGTAADMTSPNMLPLCKATDVPVDAGFRVCIDGFPPVAVFRVGGEYFVTNDTCTHGNASLADGELADEEIVCPFHLGSFNVRTGEPMAAPCVIPLRTYRVELRGDTLFADFS